MRMGRHMPVGSHATQALQLTQQIGGDTLQIFVTNPRAWQPPAPNPAAEEALADVCSDTGLQDLLVTDSVDPDPEADSHVVADRIEFGNLGDDELSECPLDRLTRVLE